MAVAEAVVSLPPDVSFLQAANAKTEAANVTTTMAEDRFMVGVSYTERRCA